MKHNLIALSFVSLALFAGCEKENEGGETRTDEKYVTITLSASCGDDTKTVLDGFNVKWNDGDKISVFIDGENCEFTAGEGGVKTTFTGNVPESKVSYDGDIYAVYPYASDYTIDGKGVVSGIEVSAVQELTAGSYDPKAGVSVATGTVSGGLKFKNVCALLKIKLDAETAVRGAQLTCPSGFALAGKGLSVNAADAKITFPANYAGCTNTVNLINNTKEGVTGKEFYMALVPGEYFGNGDYKLSVFNAEEKFASKTFSTTDDKKFERNMIASITSAAPATASYVHYGTANCISLYGKAAGEKVTIDVTPYIASDSFIATGLVSYVDGNQANKLAIGNVWRESDLTGVTKDGSVSDNSFTIARADAKTYGNMSIAFLRSKKVVWSYHIWVPEDDPEKLLAYSDYDMMPMALGAENSNEGDLSGLLYQWGRKDALGRLKFVNASSGNSAFVASTTGYSKTPVDASASLEENIANSIQSPYALIKSGSAWTGVNEDGLWGNAKGYEKPAIVSKSIYDPCPEGYMVAPADAYENIVVKTNVKGYESSLDKTGWQKLYGETNGYIFVSGGVENHMASTGYLKGADGDKAGGNQAHYWTSSPASDSGKGVRAYFDRNGTCNPAATDVSKSTACCVRCVKVK